MSPPMLRCVYVHKQAIIIHLFHVLDLKTLPVTLKQNREYCLQETLRLVGGER